MNRTKLKTYAPQARRDFITAVTDRAAYYGLTRDRIETMTEQGDVVIIAGQSLPRHVAAKRKRLEERITRQGFEQTMEAMAYTWFNRFAAIRFMELHGYLEHGYRVLSHPAPDKPTPEILEHAEHVDLPGLNQSTAIDLKLDGTRETELYRMLLMAQCNALHAAMPFLFERIDDETELLLPDNLLHSDSLIRKLVSGIDEEDWQEVEIIGWLYQFYISEKKDQVIGKVVKSEDIPAATQLFTPNWIVKYLVQNSLGRQWLATYPDSPLKQQMEYYIEPAEQTPEVQAQLKAITPERLNPEELTLLDPACGSGHILVEAYDLFKAIYQERGYRARDIPSLILQKNLYGLEIDDRAAQLAAFALLMKARVDDRRIFASSVQPHVLAIQESKGLDAKEITDALNAPILKTERPPSEYLFEELEEEGSSLFSRKNLSVKGNIAQADVAQLIDLFKHGKTFGSLIRVPEELTKHLSAIAERVDQVAKYGGMFEKIAARSVTKLIHLAAKLGSSYSSVVTNPPYMGAKFYNSSLKDHVFDAFKTEKSDLYAVFIRRCFELTQRSGLFGLITIPNWMFLSTFEDLRLWLLTASSVATFSHNGRGVWGSDFGSCAFTIRTSYLKGSLGSYKRLFEKDGSTATNEELQERFRTTTPFAVDQAEFLNVPGCPLVYWASYGVRQAFRNNPLLGSLCDVKRGMTTSDNDRFLRFWPEVAHQRIGFHFQNSEDAKESGRFWFPYNKGGPYRKWYGNNEYVVNWHNDGHDVIEFAKTINRSFTRTIVNRQYFFRGSVTFPYITISRFGLRWLDKGFIYDSGGPAIFVDGDMQTMLLGILNSNLAHHILKLLSPSVNLQIADMIRFPVAELDAQTRQAVTERVSEMIRLARDDWDESETSWDFRSLPLLLCQKQNLLTSWQDFRSKCINRHARMRQLEEENNSDIVAQYNLKDECADDVPADQITLYESDREEDIRRLISYAIGCMMGRYSLDTPGLIYAYSGNKDFDPSQYQTFPADGDGIIPLMETDWFPDDASNRLVEFISVAWPKEHLEENLKFIADSLGPNRNEQPRDTIRRYLTTGFYKHHLSMYKRRPIYWLFSSGKQRAFQCLVYLHRYHEGALSRMRTEYVVPLQGKMASRLDQLADDIAAASSTAHRKRLEKERETLRKQHTELQAFDEQLRHYADQRISLDLDDGVKVNYGKFGDLLAEVKAVTGGIEET